MRGHAALLLVLLGSALVSSALLQPDNQRLDIDKSTKDLHSTKTASDSTTSRATTIRAVSTTEDTSEILDQDAKSVDDTANNEKIQEELARVIKAQAKKARPSDPTRPSSSSFVAKVKKPVYKDVYNSTDVHKLSAILRRTDAAFKASKKVTNVDDVDNSDDDDEDEDDEYDDDDDDDDDGVDPDDDEDDGVDPDDDDDDADDTNEDDDDVISDCPDFCRCVGGQFAAATTARCSKLQEDQVFGSTIGHLRLESAAEIRLGPYALKRLGLKQLETLVIVDTKIAEIDQTAFDGLHELFVVNLTRNGLTYIHPDTFQHNTQLSLLTISGNPLRLVPRRPNETTNRTMDYLLDVPSVAELDLSGNQLSRLPKRAFAKMMNLAYINLKRNRLRSVERELFAPLEQLVELDLSHNLLSELPSDLFKDKILQTLRLKGNILTTLSSVKAPKLTTLDASMNQLKAIAKDDFAGVPYLDVLYLSSNNLRRINNHAFSNLNQLTTLDLSNNNLLTLTDHHLKANSRLQTLLLNDNPELESLPIFRTNAQEFERYSIYRFECENCGLLFIERGTFDAMPAMQRLNLARNQLSGLPRGLLRSLSSLRELDLSMNRIDRLENDIFEGANSLTKLSLAMNSFLYGLPVTPFLKTPNLSRLDLSYCNLQRIWSNTSLPFESLRFLSLHKNRLNHIKTEELRAMPKLSGLDVSRNPLKCDEELSAAIQWLTDHNVSPMESSHVIGAKKIQEPYESYGESLNQWTDLAKRLCDKWDVGPPQRPVPRKNGKKMVLTRLEESSVSMPGPFVKTDILRDFNKIDFDQGHSTGDEIDSAWTNQDDPEYDLSGVEGITYRAWWYSEAMWPAVTIVLGIIGALLVTAHIAVCLAKRRNGGPVIRRPMILRPGLVDSKNCGLVYKPLQEEIATPHMPKRGSFYSSSTFHYDKIVPESV